VRDGPGVIASCGSGVTACIVALAARLAFPGVNTNCAVFDGSWSKWAAEVTTPQLHTVLLLRLSRRVALFAVRCCHRSRLHPTLVSLPPTLSPHLRQLSSSLSALVTTLPSSAASHRTSLEQLAARVDAMDFRAVYDFFEAVYRSPGGLQGTKFTDDGRAFAQCMSLARAIATPPATDPLSGVAAGNPAAVYAASPGANGGQGLHRLL
jgi:hypothetical protein